MYQKSIYTKDHIYLIERLKKARKHAGLKQQIVADKLGRTQSYISKMESGQTRIDIAQIKRFAVLYKKALDYFIK